MLIWAGSFVFIKWGLLELDPYNLAFWRFLLASPLLFAYVFHHKKAELFKFSKRDIIPLIVLGLTGVSILYVIQFLALKMTTAINGSILINSSVLFIAIFSIAVLKENVSNKRITGIILGIFGISLVLSNGKLNFFTSSTLIGDLLMVFDGLLWAGYTIVGKNLISRYDTDAVTAWAFAIGVVTLIPFVMWTGIQVPSSLVTWASILYLALLCSFFGYLIWYWTLKVEDASRIAVYIYLIPFFTAIMAFFLLQEEITLIKVVGGAVTVIGIYLAEKG